MILSAIIYWTPGFRYRLIVFSSLKRNRIKSLVLFKTIETLVLLMRNFPAISSQWLNHISTIKLGSLEAWADRLPVNPWQRQEEDLHFCQLLFTLITELEHTLSDYNTALHAYWGFMELTAALTFHQILQPLPRHQYKKLTIPYVKMTCRKWNQTENRHFVHGT